jgi:hypothetical protein
MGEGKVDPAQWLPAKTLAAIEGAKGAIERVLAGQLTALSIVGAALNPARGDRAQAPELLAVVRGDYLGKMGALSEALAPSMRAGVRVRLLTTEEVERAADVFALEFSEWKARHRMLVGADPFAGVTVKRAHLRHAIELEARGLSRRIRNRVLAGLAAGPTRDDPSQAIRDGVDRFLVIAHHALALVGEPLVAEEQAMLDAVGRCSGADVRALGALLGAVRSGRAIAEPIAALGALITASDGVARWVDGLEAGA